MYIWFQRVEVFCRVRFMFMHFYGIKFMRYMAESFKITKVITVEGLSASTVELLFDYIVLPYRAL